MWKKNIIFDATSNDEFKCEIYDGEDIHEKVDRLLNTEQPIESEPGFQKIYTMRKDGVIPEYNVRMDKWDEAIEVMDKANKEKIVKSNEYTKATEMEKEKETETTTE